MAKGNRKPGTAAGSTGVPPQKGNTEGVFLDYRFRHPELYKQALTHSSRGEDNYERLEFLGDAVLQLTISCILFDLLPKATPGELTRWRSLLVCGATLQHLAKEEGLLGKARFGPGFGNPDSGSKVGSDLLEAILGAVYSDSSDFVTCGRLVRTLYKKNNLLPRREETVVPEGVSAASFLNWRGENSISPEKTVPVGVSAKSALQEWLQKEKRPLPVYDLLQENPSEPERRFLIACRVEEMSLGIGQSGLQAERKAAAAMLGALSGTEVPEVSAKKALREWLQKERRSFLVYDGLQKNATQPKQCRVVCRLYGHALKRWGTGRTRLQAEQKAAIAMLGALSGTEVPEASAKKALNKWLQKEKLPPPVYDPLQENASQPERRFWIACRTYGLLREKQGIGQTRLQAERKAAAAMLGALSGNKIAEVSAKQALNKWLQKEHLPLYDLLQENVDKPEQHFQIACRIVRQTQGIGRTKQEAEQQAAAVMFKNLCPVILSEA